MHVLVTGGTGELGRLVVPRLRARGHHVTVASRRPDRPGEVAFDLTDPALAVPTGVEAIVHLASDPRRLTDVDVEGTARLLGAAAAADVGHVLAVSIVGVDDHPFPYYRARRRVEELLAAGPVPWTVLRATQFPDLAARFLDQLRWPAVLPLPRDVRLQPIDPVAVADRLVAIVEDGPAGRVDDLGGPEVLELATIVRREYAARGRRVVLLPLPLTRRWGRPFRDGRMLVPAGGTGRTHGEHVRAHAPERTSADPLGRLLRSIAWGVFATTAWMALAPGSFHGSIAAYGEFNGHLLRDLATTLLPLGVALYAAASRPSWRRPVLALALLQNGLHLLNHVVDMPLAATPTVAGVNVVLLGMLQAVLVRAWTRTAGAPRAAVAPARTFEGS